MQWNERSVSSRRARTTLAWFLLYLAVLALWAGTVMISAPVDLAIGLGLVIVVGAVASGAVLVVRTPCRRCRRPFPGWFNRSRCVSCSLLFDENWPR
jgi:hypothetical protein